ncbi:Long-chain fatty acid transport protein 6 [Varanus komodoensis]|nr:Long-chain fatty acid transport protein 6 [Varanus komodoensis]
MNPCWGARQHTEVHTEKPGILLKEGERNHKVRLAVGNGVRPDVWREFLHRFGNIKICELYGATEGNICFMNHTGKIGSVGRTNFFYKGR